MNIIDGKILINGVDVTILLKNYINRQIDDNARNFEIADKLSNVFDNLKKNEVIMQEIEHITEDDIANFENSINKIKEQKEEDIGKVSLTDTIVNMEGLLKLFPFFSEDKVRRYIKNYKFPRKKIYGDYYFNPVEVQHWIDENIKSY